MTTEVPSKFEKLPLGNISLGDLDVYILFIQCEVIHTPGHTKGSVCIKLNNILFSGDTLFREGMGRVDLPGGDHEEILKSLKKIFELPENTIVYPGHGISTTILHEKQFNKNHYL